MSIESFAGQIIAANSSAFAIVVPLQQLLSVLVTTLVFAIAGILLFALAFIIITKAAPFSIRKEIEDDQNIALGIVIGAVIIGIALIVSAAIQG